MDSRSPTNQEPDAHANMSNVRDIFQELPLSSKDSKRFLFFVLRDLGSIINNESKRNYPEDPSPSKKSLNRENQQGTPNNAEIVGARSNKEISPEDDDDGSKLSLGDIKYDDDGNEPSPIKEGNLANQSGRQNTSDNEDEEGDSGSYTDEEYSDDEDDEEEHSSSKTSQIEARNQKKTPLKIDPSIFRLNEPIVRDVVDYRNSDHLDSPDLYKDSPIIGARHISNQSETEIPLRRKYMQRGGTYLVPADSERVACSEGIIKSEFEIDIKSTDDPQSRIRCNWAQGKYQLKFICFFVDYLLCFSILLTIVAFHFGKKEYTLSGISGGLDYIIQNLGSDPIMKISIAEVCPIGYSKLVLGNWPGSLPGCYCSRFDDVTKGFCPPDKKTYCDDISSIKVTPYYYWRVKKHWCAIVAKPGDDFIQASPCPNGFTECSTGMCYRNGLGCPITRVTFSSVPESTDNYPYDAGTYVNFQHLTSEPPLIGMNITFNGLPCADPNKVPSGSALYELLDIDTEGCGKLGVDANVFYLDRDTEDSVVKLNSLPKGILDLPQYENVRVNNYLTFSSKHRMKVKTEPACLNIDIKMLIDVSENSSNLDSTISVTTILAVILRCFLSVWVIFFLYKWKKSKSNYLEVFKKSVLLQKTYLIVFGLEAIVYLVMGVMVNRYSIQLENTQYYFTQISEAGCFLSPQPSQVVTDYSNLVEKVVRKLHKETNSLVSIAFICYFSLTCPTIVEKIKRRFDNRKKNAVAKKTEN